MEDAETAHARITANVDDWYADRIDHAEFHARAVRIHAEIEAAGMSEAVSAIMRDRLAS